MPSNKPRLATYTNKTIIDKFQYISDFEHRSSSKELEHIVIEYINLFEDKHGELIIDEDGTVHPKSKSTKDKLQVKSSNFKAG